MVIGSNRWFSLCYFTRNLPFLSRNIGPMREECYATILGTLHIGEMQIDDNEVYRLMNILDIHKSQGPDEIHSRLLKVFSNNPVCSCCWPFV